MCLMFPKFLEIRIRLQGREHTSWTKHETYYDSSANENKSRTARYSGNRTFLKQDGIVRDQGTLPSGKHVFPISFQLPNDIPGSFECQYGNISYTIKLTVHKAFKIDLEDTKQIKISAPLRLKNIDSVMLRGCELEDEKTICCCCCTGGYVEMQVSLHCKTFALGYPGFVKVYILNMSNVNVDDLTVTIGQTLTFKTTDPGSDYKYDVEQIAVCHNRGVDAHADKTYNLSIDMPRSAVIPNFTRCQLFRCEHELTVTAGLSGCHNNLDVSTDVAVSHEPSLNMHPPGNHEEHEPQSNAMQNKRRSSCGTIGGGEYNGEAPVISQPMPRNMPMPIPMPMSIPMPMHKPIPMPMPMPMPMPPYGAACLFPKPLPMPGYGEPPYSGSSDPSTFPSANAPSAPSELDLADNSGKDLFIHKS
ncbi:unnamed protein product [Ceutorhynchus assimilis]|uniref:Arrestin C-terminal-like domain-containing protein n=1 Tax=Ceutorhynchus assimilis TaxID=467358 RepID=A0A9N9MB74_9CUCU|nr:unnamed protein product [Ceutorhynchus assimilis]